MKKSNIKITSHRFIPFTFISFIIGIVASSNSKVQLYVKANDDKWYLQPRTLVLGRRWAGFCFLGKNEILPSDRNYSVVAVLSDKRPGSPVNVLPSGVEKSKMIRITRNK